MLDDITVARVGRVIVADRTGLARDSVAYNTIHSRIATTSAVVLDGSSPAASETHVAGQLNQPIRRQPARATAGRRQVNRKEHGHGGR